MTCLEVYLNVVQLISTGRQSEIIETSSLELLTKSIKSIVLARVISIN